MVKCFSIFVLYCLGLLIKCQEILEKFENYRYIFSVENDHENYDAVLRFCQSIGGTIVEIKNEKTWKFFEGKLLPYVNGTYLIFFTFKNTMSTIL